MSISSILRAHYAGTFREFGATPHGVDWEEAGKADLRYRAMLRLIPEEELLGPGILSLLDVGCGYGAFYRFLRDRQITNVTYTGVDLVDEMIGHASRHCERGTFLTGDILEMDIRPSSHDYVIANGIFTQKLTASTSDMDLFFERMIERLFAICRKGIAFNVMSTLVDFENPENYYRRPADVIEIASRLTRRFKVDHAYPLYEYTMSLYK